MEEVVPRSTVLLRSKRSDHHARRFRRLAAFTVFLLGSCSSRMTPDQALQPQAAAPVAGSTSTSNPMASSAPPGIAGSTPPPLQAQPPNTTVTTMPSAGNSTPPSASGGSDAGVTRADAGEVSSDATGSADWPSFGHDTDNTRYASQEKDISRENVSTLVRKWMWDGAGVTSTPAVVDGVVYFGDWNGTLHAADAKDGTEVWSVSLQSGSFLAQLNDSPLVTPDAVYVGGSGAQLFAVDRETGKKLWDPPMTLDKQQQTLLWSSPVLAGDEIVIGIGSFAVFLGGSFRGSIVGVDAHTGATRWQTFVVPESGQGVSVWSSAAYDSTRKRIYIGTGQTYALPASLDADAVVALDRDSGMLAWSHQYTVDDAFSISSAITGQDFDVGAAPNLFVEDGRALVGAGDKGGRYLALDRDTGQMVWAQTLTPGGRNGGVMGSAAYADGTIYLTSNTGEPTSLVGNGGPPASTAFALRAANGEILWKTPLPDGSFGGVTVANGVMFATTIDGMLYALDVTDGHILWMDKMGASAAGGISVVAGMVYVGHGWEWLPSGALAGGLLAYGLP